MPYQASRPHPSSRIPVVYERIYGALIGLYIARFSSSDHSVNSSVCYCVCHNSFDNKLNFTSAVPYFPPQLIWHSCCQYGIYGTVGAFDTPTHHATMSYIVLFSISEYHALRLLLTSFLVFMARPHRTMVPPSYSSCIL